MPVVVCYLLAISSTAHQTSTFHYSKALVLIRFLHLSRMVKKTVELAQTKIKCDSLYMLLGNFEFFIARKLFTEIFLSCPNKDAVILATFAPCKEARH